MATFIIGAVISVLAALFSVLGMLIVRKKVGVERLAALHEVSGDMLSVVGTLYAVLLGFVVVDAMTHMQEMRITVEQEANAVANIYLVSDGLPSVVAARMQDHCKEYVDVVTEVEWQSMTRGQALDEAHVLTWKMWREATRLQCDTEGEGAVKDRLLEELSNLSDNRRTRLVMAAHGVAPTMWFFLILGAVFTVVFTYFFGLESTRAQALMTGLIAVTLSLNLFLVYLFGYPFRGDVAVYPDAFTLDKRIFQDFHKKCVENAECDAHSGQENHGATPAKTPN